MNLLRIFHSHLGARLAGDVTGDLQEVLLAVVQALSGGSRPALDGASPGHVGLGMGDGGGLGLGDWVTLGGLGSELLLGGKFRLHCDRKEEGCGCWCRCWCWTAANRAGSGTLTGRLRGEKRLLLSTLLLLRSLDRFRGGDGGRGGGGVLVVEDGGDEDGRSGSVQRWKTSTCCISTKVPKGILLNYYLSHPRCN